ncbi:MAG: hypothetical protein HYU69_06130 [Bacteroidetes bacterium]|nr:hypothetical protein [Bacteroidota bacterium]
MRFVGTLFVLVSVFLVSVFVRMGLINNEVNNYDHCNFYLLTTFENWDERGMAACHFSPILTYNNPGDKHVAFYKRLESKEGDNYFVSFPPFSFLFAYETFKLFHIVPGKLAIQSLNIFLHFVSAFFVYLLVFRYSNKNDPLKLHLPSIVGFTVYLFIPIVLYMHTVVYFPETLGIVFWIITLYLTLRWVDASVVNKSRAACLVAIAVFFMIYTEWIGIFYVITLLIVVQRSNQFEQWEKLFLFKAVLISSVLAIALLLVQYSSIDGVASLVKAFVVRYAERSGLMDATHSDMGFNFFTAGSYMRLAANLNGVLFPFGHLLILLIIGIIFKKGYAYLLQVIRRNRLLISLATVPGIIHLFVFFNSTVIHSHCVAVLGVSIALFLGLMSGWFHNRMNAGRKSVIIQVVIIIAAVFFVKINFDGSHPSHPDHSALTKAAMFIRNDAKNDEMVFLNIRTELANPLQYVSFISKRNMLYANDTLDARKKLEALHKSKAVLYRFNGINEEPVVYRLSIY